MDTEKALRQILANQHRILAMLGDTNYDHEHLVQVYESGYSSMYFEHLDEEATEEEQEEVHQILRMFRYIKAAENNGKFATLNEDDLIFLEFRGFDSHNNSRHWGFAHQLARWGRYSDIEHLDATAGSAAYLPRYQRMLEQFLEIEDLFAEADRELTDSDLQKLIDAARPS